MASTQDAPRLRSGTWTASDRHADHPAGTRHDVTRESLTAFGQAVLLAGRRAVGGGVGMGDGDGSASRRAQGVYAAGAVSTVVATAISVASGFAAALIANRLLGKDGFGTYSIAATAVFLVALVGSLGLDRRVLYLTARAPAVGGLRAPGAAIGLLATAVLVTAGGALALAAGAVPIERATELPGLATLLPVMAGGAPLLVATWVLAEWRRGSMLMGHAILAPAASEAARALFLLGALTAAAGLPGAAVASTAALAVPVVWLVLSTPLGALGRARMPGRADLAYGLRMVLGRATKESANRLDLLIIAALGSAAAVAEYAVASRIAMLLVTAQLVSAAALGPRMAALDVAGDRDALAVEYRTARHVATVLGLLGAAAIVMMGLPVLRLFGDYAGAYPVLLILSAAFLLDLAFGPGILLLGMLGRAGAALWLRVFGLATLIGLDLALIPALGTIGASVAALIAMGVLNAAVWIAARWLERMVLVGPRDLLAPALGVALLIAAAAGTSPALCTAGLGLVTAGTVWRARQSLVPVAAAMLTVARGVFRRGREPNGRDRD